MYAITVLSLDSFMHPMYELQEVIKAAESS
jgi:hypothetical protein